MIDLPSYQATPVAAIASIVNEVRTCFHTHKAKPLEYRLVQLRKLYWALKDNERAIAEACKRDLGKPTFESFLADIDWCKNDVVFVCKNLKKWAKDEAAPDIPLMNKLLRPKIRKEPLGCVLIIGAYNFPVQLSIGPLIGAIAAGCTAVLKPSEQAPYTSALLARIVSSSLDPSAYAVVQGGVSETTALLEEKWDKIFYTGSERVGKIIAKKAAETLTPVTLELGGRNPAIITRNADPRLAAMRLAWAKIMNAGQVCVSQNYVLVDKEVLPSFIAEIRVALKEFFPNGARNSEDYGRIVNEQQFRRLKKMIEGTRGKILIGGTMDEKERFLEPTVIQIEDLQDSLTVEESFGPIIPIYPVANLDEAIRLANDVHNTPLGLYAFGSKAETRRILDETRSGGASLNDGFFHASIPTLAFGGVGSSGQGSYRGKASFDCFTHQRSVTNTPGWMEGMLSVRYPPYKGKLEQFQKMTALKPNFDRDGRVRTGWKRWLLFGGFGAAILVIAVRQYLQRKA